MQTAHIIGVVGGSGGVGASVLTAAIGVRAAQAGLRAVCLDADRLGADWALAGHGLPSRRGGLAGPEHLPGVPHTSLCPSRSGEHGMVTAEFAVALPAVVLVLALSLGALGLALDQVRCLDAARAGSRRLAGDSYGAVIVATRRAAPTGALVSLATSADVVQVSVVSRPRVAGSLLPEWLRASATASAARELSDPAP